MLEISGFQEIDHTADWALHVWAPDLVALFAQAARGMYCLSGMQLRASPRLTRVLNVQGHDSETLLVNFLMELLFLGEQEDLGFDKFDLSLEEYSLEARLVGAPIASQQKEIKAVTYHNLDINSGPRGLEVTITFDV